MTEEQQALANIRYVLSCLPTDTRTNVALVAAAFRAIIALSGERKFASFALALLAAEIAAEIGEPGDPLNDGI